ncbi:MAG: helix-turn-helix transcriptional regulator [Egibacteraceae bacterium]
MPGERSSVRLRGRDQELEKLSERLETCAAGHGQVAFVEGEAGIGKTRLVSEVVAVAEGRGFEVFQGRGDELEATRPFGVVADALGCRWRSPDPARSAIGRLIAGDLSEGIDGPISSGPGLRYRVVEALVELVEDLAAAQPVVLVLEDLHWADPSTLLAMRALDRRLGYAPVALIGTFRPKRDRGDLERLVDACVEEGGLHLRLGPLGDTAVTQLVMDILGAPPGPRLRRRLSRAGGSPLFVRELLGALRDEDAVVVSSGRAEVGDDIGLPPTLRQTILRRVSAVSGDTVELLRLASILGSTLSLTDLATVWRRPVVELLPAVDEAFKAGLLGEAGDQLAFRHDVVREAVYHDLPHAVRIGLHHEAGEALAAAGAPASRVAVHLGIAATPGDTHAVGWLCRAGREVAMRAPGVAADFFGRALELMRATDPAREGVLAEQIYGLLWAGRMAEGQALAQALLRQCRDSRIEVRLRVALSWALGMLGDLKGAVAVCDVDPVSSRLNERERAQLQASGALARATRGDADSASIAVAALARAEAFEDDAAWCTAGSAASLAAMADGRLADAIATASVVMKRAEGSPLGEMQQMVCCYVLGNSLARVDRLAEAAEVLHEGWRISRERGSTWNLPLLHGAAGIRSFLAGDWDEAVTMTETGLAIAEEVGMPFVAVSAYGLLALIAVHRGQPAVARGHLAMAEPGLASAGSRVGAYWVTWARGMEHAEAERPGEAFEWLMRSWEEATTLRAATAYPLVGPDLVRFALAAGQVDRARAATDAVAKTAALMGAASADAAALLCQGLTEVDPDILLRSVERYRHAARPFELARACEDAAVMLGQLRRLDEARPLFDEALQCYEHLGADHHTARATKTLRDRGLERRKRRRRDSPTVGWDALTEKELAVIALVAEGLTNFQIGNRLSISHHTVATHLGHVFAKLGVSSKIELAAQAARRPGIP